MSEKKLDPIVNIRFCFFSCFSILISMFFCCGHPDDSEKDQPNTRANSDSRKRDTIASTWQIPVPQTKNLPSVKKPAMMKQQADYQLAHLQNNCELILFNTKEGSELFLSFAVKKTIINFGRDSKQNYNSVDEQIYEILSKRSKDSVTLLVTEQFDEIMERKYRQYQQAYIMIMLIPQQSQYVSKFTSRSKGSAMQSSTYDDEVSQRGYQTKKTRGAMAASGISQTPVSNKYKDRLPLDIISFSYATQIKLNFFDQIYIYSPNCRDSSINKTRKIWLQNIVNSIHSLPNLQKLTIILPKEIRLVEIMDILQDLMQEKIKSHPLEEACNMIHFELECIYSDNAFTKVIVKKRYEEGDLTIMLLAINLLLIEFNAKSQEFYGAIVQHMKKLTFKDYMVIKTQMKEGHHSRRTIMKVLSENLLMQQDQLYEFGNRFAEMTRISDSWGNEMKYTFTVLRDLRVQLSEFLSCRVFIPSCSYHVLTDHVPVVESMTPQQQQSYIIVPSFKQDLQKDRADEYRLSLLHNAVEIDIEINEQGGPDDYPPQSVKKSSIDDYDLKRNTKLSRRKRSNDY